MRGWLAVSFLPLLMTSSCDGSHCRKACTKLATCVGANLDSGIAYRQSTSPTSNPSQTTTASKGFACTLSAECSPKENCLADCIEQASCDALTGKDSDGALKVRLCQAKCELRQRDSQLNYADGGANPFANCTPNCGGKQCGDDGCGGSCGACLWPSVCNGGKCSCDATCAGKDCATCLPGFNCSTAGVCEAGTTPPPLGCGNVPEQGCCSGSTVKYCESGQVKTLACSSNPSCGWNSSVSFYDCGTTGGSEPTGKYPKTCF